MWWKIARTDTQVIEVDVAYEHKGQKFEILLQSDVHFDHPKCDRRLYFNHLDEALRRNAGIFVAGDFLCLMQGRNDRRSSKDSIRSEHNTATYFDTVAMDSASQLEDYAKNFIAFSDGNHETAVVKNVETNPLSNMVMQLNAKHGINIEHLPYQCFVVFKLRMADGGGVRTVIMAVHHGKWGGVVSMGTQGVSRYAAIYPQADVVLSGHTHDYWVVPKQMYHITVNSKAVLRQQYHVKTGTYKNEFQNGTGFAVEKIVTPKPMGSWWMTMTPRAHGVDIDFQMCQNKYNHNENTRKV